MKKIAHLGLGLMGRGMASVLLEAGYPIVVWNRSPERCAPLVEAGASIAATPAQAVAGADFIIYSLSDDTAIEAVVWGDNGILAGAEARQIAIDTSTVHPGTSRRQAKAYQERGVQFLDAPVFGSKTEAATGGMWMVVGGEREAFDAAHPILSTLSASVHYMGGTGMGAATKLVGNLVVASQMEALGEALILAIKIGLDPEDVLEVFKVTDFRSPIFDGVGRRLLERDFTTHGALKHLLKDANHIARLAQELNVPLPASAATREVLKMAVNQGWAEENASAMIKALETQSGVEIKK